ncbi:hypothetical protein GOODEAATRI_033758 [Goodea atripinnis]|uniref:Uncharacterized protein n=1 Tax=Goodea atripinnis TaxID=208336 RepID=A0ABV0PTR6_9TELE
MFDQMFGGKKTAPTLSSGPSTGCFLQLFFKTDFQISLKDQVYHHCKSVLKFTQAINLRVKKLQQALSLDRCRAKVRRPDNPITTPKICRKKHISVAKIC